MNLKNTNSIECNKLLKISEKSKHLITDDEDETYIAFHPGAFLNVQQQRNKQFMETDLNNWTNVN